MRNLASFSIQRILRYWGWELVRVSTSYPSGARLFSEDEFRTLVEQMDNGDFEFDEAARNKMVQQWLIDPSLVPYPTMMTRAIERDDAIGLNSIEMMEITYRLPYYHSYEQAQEKMYRDLVELAKEQNVNFGNAVVADVGCGWGGLLSIVNQHNPPPRKLYGVECTPVAIEHMAQHRPYITGLVADLESPEDVFGSTCTFKADVIFCTAVLEHLRKPERALRNLLSLKETKGVVILVVPNGRLDTATQHINFWSPESWQGFVGRVAEGHTSTTLRCPSPNAPGGFENVALIR